MSRSTTLTIIIILSLLGLADALYLADAALSGSALSCGIQNLDGCNVVAQSAYSRFLGVPLGVYGVIFYALTLAGALIVKMWSTPRAMQGLLLIAALGALFSLYFMGLQVFVIKALCIYCALSFVISMFIFICSWKLWHASTQGEPNIPVM